MRQKSQEADSSEQERRRAIGHEAWDRLVNDSRSLGAFGEIRVIGRVEDGKLIVVKESAERTHK